MRSLGRRNCTPFSTSTQAVPVTLELIGSRVHPEDTADVGGHDRQQPGEPKPNLNHEYRIVTPEEFNQVHSPWIGHATHNVEESAGISPRGSGRDTAPDDGGKSARARTPTCVRITQAIPGMLWSATPEGAVDDCNNPWLDFAAMTAEQAMGWGWATAIYPDDRDGLIATLALFVWPRSTPFNTVGTHAPFRRRVSLVLF